MTLSHYPRYRVLTGPDDDTLCVRVGEVLDLGYFTAGRRPQQPLRTPCMSHKHLYGEDRSQLPAVAILLTETHVLPS